ncbi:hypothetical protein D9758_011963 [Tetrapyrgos nigripes]|uniref:F-box domain-containing protein n=1 Tax=Tetrapyrgos nigripes TaxID=182062 RepID=A0A8H5D327_9AGAR|nr:hypothetical protein D9758_011963 [Tetrapyrgos nigripes]
MLLLPNELLEKIVQNVERLKDRKALRRTCSRLALILRPHVLAEVTLNIHRYNLEPGMNMLRALATPGNIYSSYIRTLYIDSLSPSFYPDPRFKDKQRACRDTVELQEMGRDWVSGGGEIEEYEELRTLLRPALESIDHLQAIRWCWRLKDSQWTLDTVMQSLSALRHVKEFHFLCAPSVHRRSSQVAPPPLIPSIPLPDLWDLEVLSVEVSFGTRLAIDNASIITPLVNHLCSRSKSLTSLHIRTGRDLLGDGRALDFDSLDTSLHSSITHLSLGGRSSRALQVAKIPSYFSNLTSLQLRSEYYDEESLKSLFSGLTAKQIHLRRLVLDDVNGSLLDYIESYSGLEVLSLAGPHWYSQPEHDDMADRFYRQILWLHHNTLQRLEIHPAFEGRWCFGENDSWSIERCRNLRHLSVKVNCDGLPFRSNSLLRYCNQHETAANPVHSLLSTVHSNLPELHTLHIDSARNPSSAYSHFSDSGAERCLAIRDSVLSSIKNLNREREEADYTEVPKWVRVYIGGEMVKLAIDDDGRD